MSPEQLEALNAAIEYFDRARGAFNLTRALERLRDAEAKPVEMSADERYWAQVREPTQDIGPTQRAYDLFFSATRRLEQERDALRATCDEWNAWLDKLCGEENCVTEDGQAEIARLVELGRKAEDEDWEEELREWDDWITNLASTIACDPNALSTVERLVELGRKSEDTIAKLQEQNDEWGSWAATLANVDENDPEARDEIERLVELGRECEGEIAGLRASLSNALAAVAKWEAWIDPLSGSSQIDAAKVAVERLVELGRKYKQLVSIFAQELAGCEPTAVKVPQTEELTYPCGLCGLVCDFPHQHDRQCRYFQAEKPKAEPKPSELEAMLTALMPNRTRMPIYSWEWGYSTLGVLRINLGGNRICYPTTPAEALAAINTRLAELAPKGWRLWLEGKALRVEGASKLAGYLWFVNADLGARIAEALEWVAEREKPKPEPKAGEPITPPEKWEELSSADGASSWVEWRNPDIGWARAYLYGEIRTRSTELLSWLPQLQARARQVFGDAK